MKQQAEERRRAKSQPGKGLQRQDVTLVLGHVEEESGKSISDESSNKSETIVSNSKK